MSEDGIEILYIQSFRLKLFMKLKLYAPLLLAVLLGCQKKENEKTYVSRVLSANESFNEFQKNNGDSLVIYGSNETDSLQGDNEEKDQKLRVKFGDTIVRVQTNAKNKGISADRFASAQFLNTQKTCLLVQLSDSTGLVAPFYLIVIKDNKLEVVSLFRASTGQDDERFTKGMTKVGRSGYLINNDFFITTVNAKAYLIKRQNPEERIQGLYFLNSPDKRTLAFLVSSSLYQVHYPTGTVFTQPLSSKAPTTPSALFGWIQSNFYWEKDAKGISFLKENPDEDRVIDIKDFHKKAI